MEIWGNKYINTDMKLYMNQSKVNEIDMYKPGLQLPNLGLDIYLSKGL